MLTFEYIILGLAYTTLSIALFLQWICYKRKIESIETIAFTISLLLLIISISVSPLFTFGNTTTLSTLTCMVLVSATTFLNTLSERKHSLKTIFINSYLVIASLLLISIFVTYFSGNLIFTQYAIVAFLIISIFISVTIVQFSKPIKRYKHLEKINKVFGIIFSILVPTYLIFHYGFEKEYKQFQTGFLLYIAFTLLGLSKIYDDLQRLSLVNKNIAPQKQQFKNYGLTEREEEIAALLIQGFTYQNISKQLFISIPTVKTHASNIYKKCSVKTRHELTFHITN